MPYYEVPAEIMEDTEKLLQWVLISAAIGHATAKKKRREPSPPSVVLLKPNLRYQSSKGGNAIDIKRCN
ncbi:hypothetical protein ACFLX7_04025 [Chloroflexota bacterium]